LIDELIKYNYDSVTESKIMVRGGKREGSGNKPGWKNGKTKVIRVPEVLADQILQYARELDEGKIKSIDAKEITPMLNIVDLSGISMIAVSGEMGIKLSDLVKRGYQLTPKRINDIVLASLKSKRK
jgi:hypothetical protein